MPFPISLPRTSLLSFSSALRSSTHPSLPLQATTYRNVLRSALKEHHENAGKNKHAPTGPIDVAVEQYLPLLLALNSGLRSDAVIVNEEVDVVLVKEVQVRWRSMLLRSRLSGSKPPTIQACGLDAEVAFAMSALAVSSCLKARSLLRLLHDTNGENGSSQPQWRVTQIAAGMASLLHANAIYNYLSAYMLATLSIHIPTEISPPALSALASLTLAEATLLAVLKDDPYPSLIAAERNANDKGWMIGAPRIPKVRAHLFSRICVASADHAGRGVASCKAVSSSKGGAHARATDTLHTYLLCLRRVARAKACRFAAINAEADGAIGRAIGWLYAALIEMEVEDSEIDALRPKRSKASNIKMTIGRARSDKKEDKLIEKHSDWGSDAGKLEETRVVAMLLVKWEHINDTVDFQPVISAHELLSGLPTGRECHTSKVWTPPSLSPEALAEMRAPPYADEERQVTQADEPESSDEDRPLNSEANHTQSVPGAYY